MSHIPFIDDEDDGTFGDELQKTFSEVRIFRLLVFSSFSFFVFCFLVIVFCFILVIINLFFSYFLVFFKAKISGQIARIFLLLHFWKCVLMSFFFSAITAVVSKHFLSLASI